MWLEAMLLKYSKNVDYQESYKRSQKALFGVHFIPLQLSFTVIVTYF